MRNLSCVLLIAFLLSGCATVFTGTKDTIRFNSTPEGAIVYKDGIQVGKTPCRIPIKRSLNDTEIELELEGYETRVFTLDKEFNVVSVINLANVLGWAIDAATGALLKYDTKRYDFDLKKEDLTSFNSPKEIHVNSITKKIDVYVME